MAHGVKSLISQSQLHSHALSMLKRPCFLWYFLISYDWVCFLFLFCFFVVGEPRKTDSKTPQTWSLKIAVAYMLILLTEPKPAFGSMLIISSLQVHDSAKHPFLELVGIPFEHCPLCNQFQRIVK